MTLSPVGSTPTRFRQNTLCDFFCNIGNNPCDIYAGVACDPCYLFGCDPSPAIVPSGSGPTGVNQLFPGEDCVACWPIGPSVTQIMQAVLHGNLYGALQQMGAVPDDGYDCTSGTCMVSPVMDAEPAAVPCEDQACELARAINMTGVQTLQNPCTIGLIYAIPAGGAAAATVDSVGVVATLDTWGVPATAGLTWLYKLNPATLARSVGNALEKAGNAIRSGCGWVSQ